MRCILIFLLMTLLAPALQAKVPSLSVPSSPARPATGPSVAPATPGNSRGAAPQASARPGLPTIQDITDLIDAKKYQQALAPIARLLELKGPAAAPYDRHRLFILRAECQLQLRDPKAAVATLAADLKELQDIEKGYEALAFSELINKSRNGTVAVTTGGTTTSYNIFDPTKRKEAYAALHAATFKTFESAAKPAAGGNTIPPIVQAARLAPVARALEFIVTRKTTQCDALVEPLKNHVIHLVTNPIKDMARQVNEIGESANQIIIDITPGAPTTPHRQGPSEAQARSLANTEDTCHQLITAAQELAQLLPEDRQNFQDLADIAVALGKKAQGIRLDKY